MSRRGSVVRIVTGRRPPNLRTVAQWIGGDNHRRWEELRQFIGDHYPERLKARWSFGGQREGWRLRFAGGKSFCTLVPERDRFLLLVPLQRLEWSRARELIPGLLLEGLDEAAVEAGRCELWLDISDDTVLAQAKQILALKRPPKCLSA